MRDRLRLIIATGLLLSPALTRGEQVKTEPVSPENPAHQELRALRDTLVDAVNRNDLDALLDNVTEDAVLTWQDAVVSRGRRGLRDYYNRMMRGEHRVVERVTARATVDGLTRLYGPDLDSGLAFGDLAEDFVLRDGMSFHLANRWTAHVVKDQGRWKVSGFHVSANVFDNPILHLVMKRTALWTGVVVLLAGFALGLAVGWLLSRRRRRAPP